MLGVLGLLSASFLSMLIAVFVYTGAQGELVHERVRTALEGLRISDSLPPPRRPPPVIRSDARVADVLPRMQEASTGSRWSSSIRGGPR